MTKTDTDWSWDAEAEKAVDQSLARQMREVSGLKSQPLLGYVWRPSGVRPPRETSQSSCRSLFPPLTCRQTSQFLVWATEFWSSAWASILFSSSQLEWLHIGEQSPPSPPTPLQPSSQKWGHSLFLSVPAAPMGSASPARTGEISRPQIHNWWAKQLRSYSQQV